jgi:hypothetical protein
MTVQGLIVCSGSALRAEYNHCFVDTMQQRESIDAERENKAACLWFGRSIEFVANFETCAVRAMHQRCREPGNESLVD